jgi:dUTP pyrophosphatase
MDSENIETFDAKETLTCSLLFPTALSPRRSRSSDAGYDLHAFINEQPFTPDNNTKQISIFPFCRTVISTGISVQCPSNVAFQIWPRSGWALHKGIDVMAGLIDSGYRGEIRVILYNTSKEVVIVHHGDRIAQLVPVVTFQTPYLKLPIIQNLNNSDRGVHGFGSSGK